MTYVPIKDRQWPPKPKTPVEIAEHFIDDANALARFNFDIITHRNPAGPYLWVLGGVYGVAFGSSYVAGASFRTASMMGRFAVARFFQASVVSMNPLISPIGSAFWALAAIYYGGRNVAHAIDPEKGEARFHYALINPGSAFTETQYNIASYYLDRKLSQHLAVRSGGGGGGF